MVPFLLLKEILHCERLPFKLCPLNISLSQVLAKKPLTSVFFSISTIKHPSISMLINLIDIFSPLELELQIYHPIYEYLSFASLFHFLNSMVKSKHNQVLFQKFFEEI